MLHPSIVPPLISVVVNTELASVVTPMICVVPLILTLLLKVPLVAVNAPMEVAPECINEKFCETFPPASP